MTLGWVYQIILSEIYGVPATIEGGFGKPNTGVSFYDRASRVVLPDFYQENSFWPVDQLLEADRVNGDCSMTEKACSHVMPEGEKGYKRLPQTMSMFNLLTQKMFIPQCGREIGIGQNHTKTRERFSMQN